MKELYDVSLKATSILEIGDRKIEVGENIAIFDKILFSTFGETKDIRTAHGGYGDRNLIYWETAKDIKFTLDQGVFSKTQMALMTNTKLLVPKGNTIITLSRREKIETDENGVAATKYKMREPIFVYDELGARITDAVCGDTTITISEPYKTLIVDYQYDYDNGYTSFVFGQNLTNKYLSLEGKTRVKDDATGQVTTGVIKIPKLRLLSNLSMRLGDNVAPITNQLNGVALPVGERGHEVIMEMAILCDDIDSDI